MKALDKQAVNIFNDTDKSDWKSFRFGDIAFNISERVEPSNTDAKIYVGLEHLDPDSIHIRRTGVPSDVEGTKLKVYKGDIIFGKRRAYQRKAAIANFDGICSAHSMVLRANSETIDPELFPFFMHSDAFMSCAVDISEGSLSPTIKWKVLSEQKFRLPPRPLQKKLAELLWVIDKTENNQLASLESMKNYQKSFVNELYSRLNKHGNYKGLLSVKIKDCTSLVADRSKIGEWPYIEIGDVDIDSKEYSYKDKKSVTGSIYAKQDDVIISKVRPTRGAISIIKENVLIVSGAFTILKANKTKVDPKYLFFVIRNNNYFLSFLGNRSTGTTYPTCSDDDILDFKIPLPTIADQKEILDLMYKFDANSKSRANLLNLTRELKHSIINYFLNKTI